MQYEVLFTSNYSKPAKSILRGNVRWDGELPSKQRGVRGALGVRELSGELQEGVPGALEAGDVVLEPLQPRGGREVSVLEVRRLAARSAHPTGLRTGCRSQCQLKKKTPRLRRFSPNKVGHFIQRMIHTPPQKNRATLLPSSAQVNQLPGGLERILR